METKHTKGELTLDKEFFGGKDNKAHWIEIKSGDITIAEVKGTHYDVPNDVCEANAKLFVMAPKLLENLIRCVDRLEENGLGDMSAVTRAKKAIKKATE